MADCSLMGDCLAVPVGSGLFAIIDHADRELVCGHRWHVCRFGKRLYAYRRTETRARSPRQFMHRLILGLPAGCVPEVDHVNGNGLDNRRGNLRAAQHIDNARNRGPNANNRTGFKGVHWHQGARKWRAKIHVRGVSQHLGLFHDPVDAALAYDLAALDHFGEFAWTNFLQPRGGKA